MSESNSSNNRFRKLKLTEVLKLTNYSKACFQLTVGGGLVDRNQTFAILRLWQFFLGNINFQDAVVELSRNIFFRDIVTYIEATTARANETFFA